MADNNRAYDETALAELANAAFADGPHNPLTETHALVASVDGEVVFERYQPQFDAESTFLSWSMAKSVTSALCGVLVDQGLVELDTPAAVPTWHQDAGDPRAAITLRHLLEMRSGLAWNEDYVDAGVSDVIEMLFASGQHDVAQYAIDRPLVAAPGTEFVYSSGTTNIIARILGDALGGDTDAFTRVLVDELLRPAGMTKPTIKFDGAGTFIGSSFLYATARDYIKFGELFRNDGVAGGVRLLPEGWVDASVEDHSTCPDTGQGYGFQWWIQRDGHGSYSANGYDGQRLWIAPELGLTFVRVGKTSADYTDDLTDFFNNVVSCFL